MENKTLVTVHFTNVKFYNESTNTVESVKVAGKLNTTQSRTYATDNGGIFISKDNVKESFEVDTIRLIQLKEE